MKIPVKISVLHSEDTASYEFRFFCKTSDDQTLIPADVYKIGYQDFEMMVKFHSDLTKVLGPRLILKTEKIKYAFPKFLSTLWSKFLNG